MSPLIHAEIGWLVALPLDKRRDRVLVTLASLIPDVDGLGLLVSEELYAQWHHKLAHGVFAAAVVTAAAALASTKGSRALTSALALAAVHAHIAMDLCGSGPGWPILYVWPIDDVEWLPSWQWNLASWQNAVFGMAATFACLACAVIKGRTPVELFSTAADAKVVATLRARFGRP